MRSRCFAWPSRPPAFRSAGDPSAALGDVRDGAGHVQGRHPLRRGRRPTGSSRTAPVSRRSASGSSRISSPPGSISAPPARSIGELEALVRVHPQREGLWALLMVALYRDGRQADALATYQRARSWLADELGLDPGLQLQQLEQQILVHDPALGAPYSTVRGLGPDRPPGTCRRCPRSSSAATTEVAAVVDLLADARLVEIVGPGGVGKTAVAIAAGRALSAAGRHGARRRVAGPTREPPRLPTRWSTRWSRR